ncbi:hypothetical protein K431DRAFT_280927 [Polychaeton citri CBS 116435]|uniref:Stress-associated endoplasmic reticulum protein n=1 Tax=Polychaeton citri CBS 116435 TaxID=1314669 RepID=A0A9P4QGW7_9PEZI|nr:hypothetical protein K431DRAFT_280927 [Polychaeton citri CBS 116435]
MAQTPQQRKANLAYARSEQTKRGKAPTAVKGKEKPAKAPVSKLWVYLLIFVVIGGLVFELLRAILGMFS